MELEAHYWSSLEQRGEALCRLGLLTIKVYSSTVSRQLCTIPQHTYAYTNTLSLNSRASESLHPASVSTFYILECHLMQKLKEIQSPNAHSDGEIKMRMNTAHEHLNFTLPFDWKYRTRKWKEKKKWVSVFTCWSVWACALVFGARWRLWASVELRPGSVRGTVTWRRVNISMTLAPLQQLWPLCPSTHKCTHTTYGGGLKKKKKEVCSCLWNIWTSTFVLGNKTRQC